MITEENVRLRRRKWLFSSLTAFRDFFGNLNSIPSLSPPEYPLSWELGLFGGLKGLRIGLLNRTGLLFSMIFDLLGLWIDRPRRDGLPRRYCNERRTGLVWFCRRVGLQSKLAVLAGLKVKLAPGIKNLLNERSWDELR